MFDPVLRKLKDRALDVVARELGTQVSPNICSMASFAAGLMAVVAAFRQAYLAALGLWLLNRLLDGLDGSLARVHRRQTDFGGYLDILFDFVVYAALPAAIVLGMPRDEFAYVALVVLLGSYYLNAASWMYLAAILEKRGRGASAVGEQTTVTMPQALIGGSETIIMYVAWLLVPRHVALLMSIMAALVGVSVLQRIVWASRNLGASRSSTNAGGNRIRGIVAWCAVASAASIAPIALGAQQTAVIKGAVRSATGAPVSEGYISFEFVNPSLVAMAAQTAMDDTGRFSITVSSRTGGELIISAPGFQSARVNIPPLQPGASRELTIVMSPIFALDAVTVIAAPERPLLNTRDAVTGGSVDRVELLRLPSDARNPIALAFTIPGVAQATGFFGDAPLLTINGANSLYTQYNIDGLDNNEGFLGGPRVEFPLAGMRRLTVLANSYASDWGRSSNGIVNVETRSGTERWSGEIFGYNRPGIPIDARPRFAPAGVDPDGFRRTQVGAAVGGPLVKDRTFAFATAEYSNEMEDRIGSTAQTMFLGTELRETLKLFGRVDHGWSPLQTSTLRFALSDVSRAGQGGGAIVPEADITTRRIGSITSVTHATALRGGKASNSLSAQLGTFHWYFPPTVSSFSTPQVTIVARDSLTVEAVVGSSNFVFDERETQLQLRNVFESRVGERHSLRVGADVTASRFRLDASGTNPLGAYTVINDGNIAASGPFVSIRNVPPDVRVVSYTIDAAPQQVNLTQTLYAAFVEDVWRITPSFTANLGLRWDYDDITSRGASTPDLDNFQPRASFNWYASAASVVRGGAGIYTGKFPYAVYSDAVQFGVEGNAVVTLRGQQFPPPKFGEGPTANQLGALQRTFPPREIRETFALGLEQPESRQLSLGYQRLLGGSWGVSIDAVAVETRNLPRSFDLNANTRPRTAADTVNLAPEAGDAFRQVAPAAGSFRRRTTTESGGESNYVGLYTNFRRRIGAGTGLEATWVWSRARNNTEDINFNASYANDFDAEWADAINDRRHKVSVRGVHELLPRVRVSGIADFQTGTPINRIASFRDLDGSGGIFGNGFVGNHDRFPGVPRNGERLPRSTQVAVSLDYGVPIGLGGLAVRADIFNLFNTRIVTGFANGVPGGGPRTQVGRPGDPLMFQIAGPSRQFQFSARYSF
ncbi:MAG: TonB-dependent receptor [Gemmatimonadota bacterium]|nr:TonB-dependent receptor [Gemmatimonadota bacterium]